MPELIYKTYNSQDFRKLLRIIEYSKSPKDREETMDKLADTIDTIALENITLKESMKIIHNHIHNIK